MVARKKRRRNISAKGLRAQLQQWYHQHEYDLSTMIEDKPLLFQALLEEPILFADSKIGKIYSRLVKSAVGKAEKSAIYRDAFVDPREEIYPKDQFSIGRKAPRKVR
jgi:hypothetical protein